ncbi:MAG: aldo/keto reductase [Limnochordia bacterium]|nr:4Fe-4S binding protein [Bacillota bacterium]
MEKRLLGKRWVSRLCFGSLGLGPLHNNLSVEEGAALLREAFEQGVNFVDTAELYGTYPHIREALRGYDGEVIIATKSYASGYEEMAQSLERARRELDRDVIEIFLLHEQESSHTLRGHAPALEYLVEAKERGLVEAVGISTHTVAGVRAAAAHPQIEIISPLINLTGVGIVDGSREDMLSAMEFAASMGKGLYGMKPLAGGHLSGKVESALEFVLAIPTLASVALGMKSRAELMMNLSIFAGKPVPQEIRQAVAAADRWLHIDDWCTGCGSCVDACPSRALRVVGGRCQVDRARCVLCGYCGAACPDFALKIV